ncbi:MAG: hypothetical protein HY720_07395 [Planctomycetes bacterium]|nr:hypothetical protein [Planctomycetota bacterium]
MNQDDQMGFDRLQIFVPEGERASKATPVELHDRWLVELLRLCGKLFGGATAYGRGVGVWRDESAILWDRVTVVEAWIDPAQGDPTPRMRRVQRRLNAMRRALGQRVVGYVYNGRMEFAGKGGRE